MNLNFNTSNQKIFWDKEWVNNSSCLKSIDETHNPELDENQRNKINDIMHSCAHGDISIETAISELEKFDAKNFDRLKTEAGQDVVTFELNGTKYTIIVNKSSTPTEFEKIQKEWMNVALIMKYEIDNAQTFKEFVLLNQKLVKTYEKYIGKMAACEDISYDEQNWLTEANDSNIERAKEFSYLMQECESMEAASRDFIKDAIAKFPGWEDLKNKPVIAKPGKCMLEVYKIYKLNPDPSISLSGAYRQWLRWQMGILSLEYDVVTQEGKIDSSKTVKFENKDAKIDTEKLKEDDTSEEEEENESSIF